MTGAVDRLAGAFLGLRHEVAVRRQHQAGVPVTEPLADRDDGRAGGQEHARVVVTQVV